MRGCALRCRTSAPRVTALSLLFVAVVFAPVTADAAATATAGEGGVRVRLGRNRTYSGVVPAVRAFLEQLQVYKATADAATGLPWFTAYFAVPDAWLPLRDLAISKRKPRQACVQPVLAEVASAPGTPGSVTTVTGGAQAAGYFLAYAGSQEGLASGQLRATLPCGGYGVLAPNSDPN